MQIFYTLSLNIKNALNEGSAQTFATLCVLLVMTVTPVSRNAQMTSMAVAEMETQGNKTPIALLQISARP
jgi:hypothetical protein